MRPTRRPSLNEAPFRVVVSGDFRLKTRPLRAVTIFATVDKEYLIMIIPTAKIPSTPHNDPRASAPATHNKKGDPPDRPYEIAHCFTCDGHVNAMPLRPSSAILPYYNPAVAEKQPREGPRKFTFLGKISCPKRNICGHCPFAAGHTSSTLTGSQNSPSKPISFTPQAQYVLTVPGLCWVSIIDACETLCHSASSGFSPIGSPIIDTAT